MRVLVTGGCGFIGSHVVRTLLEGGHEVTVVDHAGSPPPGSLFVWGDIRDPEDVAVAMAPGFEAIVHLAARTGVLDSVGGADEAYRTNLLGTQNLLESAQRAGVERFVLASTNAVVGDVGRAVIDEQTPLRPLTPYGATKAACEALMSDYSASYGLKTVALRFTNVYGPGMTEKDSFIARLMRAARDGQDVEIFGDGEQLRDNLFVLDAVAAVDLALKMAHSDALIVGSGRSVSVNRLVALVRSTTGVDIAARHVPPKGGEMPAVIVDNSRARSHGWAPAVDLAAGLSSTWEEFRRVAEPLGLV